LTQLTLNKTLGIKPQVEGELLGKEEVDQNLTAEERLKGMKEKVGRNTGERSRTSRQTSEPLPSVVGR